MNKKTKIFLTAAVLLVLIFVGFKLFSGPKERSVCLDAGHGGSDVGATSSDGERYEKDDNLKLTLAVGKILKENDVKVYYTRKDDETLSLEERTDYANKKKAACFVSLHRNSADDKSVKGAEIWVKSTRPLQDSSLANQILSCLGDEGINVSRGVRYGYVDNALGNYAVNSATKMPSCLVETGFITTNADNELFDEKLDDYANAIANGIIAYLEG